MPSSVFRSQGGIDRYVKKRKLDPLESYIPAILVAQSQLLDVPAAAQEFDLEAARTLLREGAFVGLRDNIRAVGEYAETDIGKDAAKARVTAFFKAIEALDQTLFLEIRKPEPKTPDNLQELVDAANTALLKTLETVPEGDVENARLVVDAIRQATSFGRTEATEAELEAARRLSGLL